MIYLGFPENWAYPRNVNVGRDLFLDNDTVCVHKTKNGVGEVGELKSRRRYQNEEV